MTLSVNFSLLPLCVDFDSPGDYFLFIFHTLAGVSTVLVASSVVLGILNTRPLMRQNRFIFMLNTSLCDTLTGFSIFYQFLFDVRVTYPSKNVTDYILPSLLGVNMMTFLCAQFDRYFAVCHPFIYGRFITIRVVVCANVMCWLYVYGLLLIQLFVPMYIAIDIEVYSRISVQVIIVAKVAMTFRLLIVARQQLLREPPGPDRDSKKESLLIVIVAVVFFLLLWSPALIYRLVSRLTGINVEFKNDATDPVRILSRSNALCTPTLYLWASPSLRAAVWKTVWGRICCCKRPKRSGKVGMVILKISKRQLSSTVKT